MRSLSIAAWTVFAILFLPFFNLTLAADTLSQEVNITNFNDDEYTWNFSTGGIISIDSISVEMSHEDVNDVQVFLENIGGGAPYVFFTLINGPNDDMTENSIGANDGDLTDLNGMSTLTFVESGPATTVRDAVNFTPSGEYLAEDWENHFGSGVPPYEPTDWRLVIRDPGFVNAAGAIGTVSITFTSAAGVPEPGSLALLGLMGLLGLARRKR